MSEGTYNQLLEEASGSNGTYTQQLAQLVEASQGVQEAVDNLGTFYNESGTVTSVPNNAETNICSVDLPAGTYVAFGYWRFTRGSGTYQASLALSTASGTSQASSVGYTQFPCTSECNVPAVTVGDIVVLNEPGTLYLVAWQNSGSAKTVTYSNIQVVRIK